MSKLRIAEIFESIQGEGLLTGTPSTFIRVSGCNLRCSWCDTPYASWNPEGPTLTVDEILEQVGSPSHVVLTGGEPMLFDSVERLCSELKKRGVHITIETAGTVFRKIECDLMSISPKLANSTPDDPDWRTRHEETRQNLTPLTRLIETYPHQLKFVVGDQVESDFEEINQLLQHLPPVEKCRVLIMPEGIDTKTLTRRMKALIEPVIHEGWRLCPRLHVELFGNTRGT